MRYHLTDRVERFYVTTVELSGKHTLIMLTQPGGAALIDHP